MFKFRLEPLITIRENVRKERQAELVKAYEARQKIENEQQGIEQAITENIEEARNQMLPGKAVNIEHLLYFRRHEMFLRAKQNELAKMAQMIDEEIERRRLAVIEADKECKSTEKLKESQFKKYTEEERKTENKQMDEIAGSRKKE
ncbi:MAG: flagellar export protein FliJ [Planctomycetaceae bacterium]|jgi:flagellar export protein FliJ|nr:flagellar export protein FliJ [Planctomycetaceae bacterium]